MREAERLSHLRAERTCTADGVLALERRHSPTGAAEEHAVEAKGPGSGRKVLRGVWEVAPHAAAPG